jgi:hypothetical protein
MTVEDILNETNPTADATALGTDVSSGTLADPLDPANVTADTLSTVVTPGSIGDPPTTPPPSGSLIDKMIAKFIAETPTDPAEREQFYNDMSAFLQDREFALAAAKPPIGITPVQSNVQVKAAPAAKPAANPAVKPFVETISNDPFANINNSTAYSGPFGDLNPLDHPSTHGNPVGSNISIGLNDAQRAFTPITHRTNDGGNPTQAQLNNNMANNGTQAGTTFGHMFDPINATKGHAMLSNFKNAGSNKPATPEISTPLRSTSLPSILAANGPQEPRSVQSDSRPAFGTPTIQTDYLDKTTITKINATELFDDFVPSNAADVFIATRARKLAMDEKVYESRRIASRKSTVNTFCHIDPMDLHKLNVEKSGSLSNVDRVLFQLRAKIDEFGFNHLFIIVGVEPATNENGRVLVPSKPLYGVDMIDSHGYKSLNEAFVMNYATFLYHFLAEDDAEMKLIRDELSDSFQLIMNCCDSYLRGQIEHEFSTRPDYYKPHHQSGPVALFLALRFITITSPHEIRLLINQLVSLKLTNVQGEDVTFFLGQCRTLINRIANPSDRSSEFYDILLDALNECTVAKFTSDLSAWCSAREVSANKDPKNYTDLMAFATQRYQDMVTAGRWLPTSKGKLSYFSPASTTKPASSNNKSNSRKPKATPAATPQPAAAATTPTPKSEGKKRTFPAWRTTPPDANETVRWNKEKTRSFQWCSKCALWTNHNDSGHKTKEVLEAERAARSAASPGTSVSFSGGNAPKTQS